MGLWLASAGGIAPGCEAAPTSSVVMDSEDDEPPSTGSTGEADDESSSSEATSGSSGAVEESAGSDPTAGSGEPTDPTPDGWAIVDVGTDADLVAVDFADAMHGWVVGTDELLLHTDDGGDTWTSQGSGFFASTVDTVQVQAHVVSPGPAWGAYHLLDVHAVGPSIAWIASIGPLASPPSLDPDHLTAVFVTDDAGASWTRLTLATNFQVWGIFGFDAQSARAASIGSTDHPDSDIYRIDGGASQASVPMTFLGLRDLAYFGDGTGITVGSGGIYRATPGNDDWAGTAAPSGMWWAVSIADDGVAFAAGEAGLVARTSDAGVSWEALTSGTSANLYGIDFVDASHGFAVGDTGVVLRTEDGGSSWTIEDGGTTAFLNDVAATTPTTAWATGDGGILLHRE